jgi:hypothetical protein
MDMHKKSNAVLTPHLNHPNSLIQKTQSRMVRSKIRRNFDISESEKRFAKQWCERQAAYIASMPSNAVLKPTRTRK